MCETCKPPVASLRAPNRHPSFYFQSQRAPRSDANLAVRRIRQNSTEYDKTLRKLVRARARGNGVLFPYSEETAAMCETCKPPVASLRAPNRHRSFHSQSQRAPRSDAKLAVRKIRQNTTECDKMLRKLVRARARGNSVPFFISLATGCDLGAADSTYHIAPPSRHANRPNGTPSSQLVACNSHVCYYFPSIGERRQT